MEEEKTPQKSPETQKKPLLPKYQWSWKFFFNSFVWLGLLMFIVDLITKWVAVKSLGLDSYTTTGQFNKFCICMLCFAGALGNGIDRTFYWPAIDGLQRSGGLDSVLSQSRIANGWFPFPDLQHVRTACLTSWGLRLQS
jgi:hypothetical protein